MVSKRLKEILDILRDYHSFVIENNTLQSQNIEETLKSLKVVLWKDGDIIEDYLRWRVIPKGIKTELSSCINSLSGQMEPWSLHISSVGREWCRLMFKDYPLTISPEHINTLYNNINIEDE